MRKQDFNLDFPVDYQVASLESVKQVLNDYVNALANALAYDRLGDTAAEYRDYLLLNRRIVLPQFDTVKDYQNVCEQLKNKTIRVSVSDNLSEIIGRTLLVFIDEDKIDSEILTLAEALGLAEETVDRKIERYKQENEHMLERMFKKAKQMLKLFSDILRLIFGEQLNKIQIDLNQLKIQLPDNSDIIEVNAYLYYLLIIIRGTILGVSLSWTAMNALLRALETQCIELIKLVLELRKWYHGDFFESFDT